MRIKPILTMLSGLALAAGSVFLAKEHLLTKADTVAGAPTSDLVEIYVARSDIAFGQAIESHLVALHKWPREALPAGAFTDLDQLVPKDLEQMRRAKGRFFPGEVMLASKISDFGEKVTLVQKLGTNTRAMAIKVDAVTAVGGFLTPGDYVDIVLTQGAQLDLRAVTILQNIRVIGIDQQSEELNDQPEVARTVTVEVTPDQGQRLALAQRAGTLNLTLRTLNGVENKTMEMVRLRDLLQEEVPTEEAESQPTVKVRRGTELEIVTIKRSPVVLKPVVDPEVVLEPATSLEPATTQEPATGTELPVGTDVNTGTLPRVNPRMRPISVTQVIGQ